jgi:hypothetical protein
MNEVGRAFAMVILSAFFFCAFLLLGLFSLVHGYWNDKSNSPQEAGTQEAGTESDRKADGSNADEHSNKRP